MDFFTKDKKKALTYVDVDGYKVSNLEEEKEIMKRKYNHLWTFEISNEVAEAFK